MILHRVIALNYTEHARFVYKLSEGRLWFSCCRLISKELHDSAAGYDLVMLLGYLVCLMRSEISGTCK